MRADRLLSILMLLQKNGRMTARELAIELEVSERTIYRDVDALSYSGVPVYCERGPGGGVELLQDYRSDLTGLNQAEIRALLMLGVPAHLADLGLEQDIKSALRKLTLAVPRGMETTEERSKRFFIDPDPLEDPMPSTSMLQVVQQAVWGERPLNITYQSPLGPSIGTVESTMHPYGLVAKDGHWYLVGQRDEHKFVIDLERIIDAEIQQDSFHYPRDFSLPLFWKAWVASRKASRPRFRVVVEISRELLPFLKKYTTDEPKYLTQQDGIDLPQRMIIDLTFSSLEAARVEILKHGGGIKVLEPTALKLTVRDFAQQTIAVNSD